MHIRIFTMLVALCLCVAESRAIAQGAEPGGDEERYRAAVERAIEEFGLGNFEEAREQFALAYEVSPNARALRGLGMSEFELRNYVSAAGYLERALRSDDRALDGKIRQEAESLLARTRAYVGEVRLTIAPASATVRVDEEDRPTVVGASLALSVGRHVLEFRADGFASERRQVTVRGGHAQSIQVALLKASGAPAARDTEARGELSPKPVYKAWWLWTTIGVVVVGATATALALSLREKDAASYEGKPTSMTPSGFELSPRVRY